MSAIKPSARPSLVRIHFCKHENADRSSCIHVIACSLIEVSGTANGHLRRYCINPRQMDASAVSQGSCHHVAIAPSAATTVAVIP